MGSPPSYHYSYTTAESHLTAMATRCNRYWWAWDSGSEVAAVICLLRSLKKWPTSGPITPKVSTTTGTKKWLESRWEYFALFLRSISAATTQLPLLQVLDRKGPRYQGRWRPRPTLYHPSWGQWGPHLGVFHLTCKCPWVLSEMESSLPPVTSRSWQHHSQHYGVSGVPCWNGS